MNEFAVRELTDEDADVQAFVDELQRLDTRVFGMAPRDLQEWDRMVGPHLRLFAAVDGVVVGAASACGMPYDEQSPIGLGLVIEPTHRRAGIGSALLERLEAWARPRRQHLRLTIAVPHDDAYSLAWWRRRGFAEQDRYVVTEATMAALELGEPPVIEGVTLTSLAARDDLRHATYDAVAQMRRDMPGEFMEMQPYEEWIDMVDRGERPAPSVILAVTTADEVVGVCTLNVSPANPERAHTGFTGVARDWRGRGIAAGLKHHQLAWCRDAGCETLRTVNHDDNAAMRTINERAGFRDTSIQVVLQLGANAPVQA